MLKGTFLLILQSVWHLVRSAWRCITHPLLSVGEIALGFPRIVMGRSGWGLRAGHRTVLAVPCVPLSA